MSTHFNRNPSESTTATMTSETNSNGSNIRSQAGQINQKVAVPISDDDYERRFSEDPMFEETGPNARVWRTYLAESADFDENIVGEARDGLDSMLIFAGLFSSVVTSFLVQTYQNLQPPVTALIVAELITVQRAAAGNIPLPPSNVTSILNMGEPNTMDIWITGIWVLSLSLSLIVALASVLVKQWLYHYLSLPSGTSGERARLRHYRYIGFQKWQVLPIIGSLPVIMHLSLALFFAGLFEFLRPVSHGLSDAIGGITLLVYVLYLVTNILPTFYPQCPYQTPLSGFFYKIRTLVLPSPNQSKTTPRQSQPSSLKGAEGFAARAIHDSLSLQALHWLYTMSSNPSVHSVVIQAIGGLSVSSKLEVGHLFSNCTHDIERLLLNCTSKVPGSLVRQAQVGLETVAERICRTISFLSASSELFTPFFSPTTSTFLGVVTFPTASHDPHFEASSLSIDLQKGIRSAQEFRAFISTHHLDLSHHPVVWNQLLFNALENEAFVKFSKPASKEDAAFCNAVFRAIWPPLSLPLHPDSSPVTMADAVHAHWRKEYVGWLRRSFLKMLSRFTNERRYSDESIDPIMEISIAAMDFALWHIIKAPTIFESSHWDIVDHVFAHYDFTMANAHFDDFVVRLIEKSDILVCENSSDFESDMLFHRRTTILDAYETTRRKVLSTRVLPPGDRPEFALLDRSIQGTFRSMRDLVGQDPAIPESSSLLFLRALDVLSLALRNGSPNSYEFVFKYRCPELLYRFGAKRLRTDDHNHNIRFIDCYLVGIQQLTPESKEAAIDHLYELTNLRLVVILISHTLDKVASNANRSSDHTILLDRLTQLRPNAEMWSDCLSWLNNVREWATDVSKTKDDERQQQIQTFVQRRLGEEWLGTMLYSYMMPTNLPSFRTPPFIRELQDIIRCIERFSEAPVDLRASRHGSQLGYSGQGTLYTQFSSPLA